MGDPACHLLSTCLSCGRFVGDEPHHEGSCPHCAAPLHDVPPSRPLASASSANLILYCETWAETVAFYANRLGLEQTYSNDWFVEFRLCPTASVSIADASRATVGATRGVGVTLSVEVESVEDVHGALRSRGVDVGGFIERFGSRVFDVRDPEGNRIEFWSSS